MLITNPVTKPSNDDGFTLIEIVVAMGLAAVLLLFLMSIFDMSAKGSRNVSQMADSLNLQSLVQLDFNVANSCRNTMVLQPTPLTFPVNAAATTTLTLKNIYDANTPPKAVASVAPAIPNNFGSVKLSNLALQFFTPNGSGIYRSNLVITTSGIGASLGSSTFTESIPVSVSVTISGNTATIIGCSGSGAAVVNNLSATNTVNTV